MEKKVHKYNRKLNPFRQYRACDGAKCTGAENVTWFWAKVSCANCKKKEPK